MPARKHREGAALDAWLDRKDRHSKTVSAARSRMLELSDHTLLRPTEAAAMLSVTTKTLREMEARGELPPRVVFSAKVFGWRLAAMEKCVKDREMVRAPAQTEQAA